MAEGLLTGSLISVMSNSVSLFVAAQILRLLPRQSLSRAVGRLCDRELPPSVSRAAVAAWCRAYGVDLSEVEAREWSSFDSFFVRSLKPNSRPIEAPPEDVVSPADGVLQTTGPIERGARIVVKGRPYDVARLIECDQDAREYVAGQYAVVYLSPRDYHRVHAPVEGPVTVVRSLGGDFFPVNAIGERWVRDLFVTNRRVVVVQESKLLGRVTTVLVAAMVVGRITVSMVEGRDTPVGIHRLEPAYDVRRGDEIGAFHLGSTAIVLVGPQASAWHRAPGLVRVGQSLTRSG